VTRAPTLVALVFAACGDAARSSGFSNRAGDYERVRGSTGGSSTFADTTSTGPADDSAGSSGSSSTGILRDVGTAMDFGPVQPPGCKGKVDLLFVISRLGTMVTEQDAAPRQLPGLHRHDRADARGLRRPHHDGQPGRHLAGLGLRDGVRAATDYWPNCGPDAQDYDCGTYPDLVTECDEVLGAGLTSTSAAARRTSCATCTAATATSSATSRT
jgi:hypothetical protein